MEDTELAPDELELAQKMKEFNESKQQEVHKVVNIEMIRKIVTLKELADKAKQRFEASKISTRSSLDNGDCNEDNLVLMDLLTRELQSLLELTDVLKLTSLLSIPSLEKAHSFEVAVQAEIISELSTARKTSIVVLDTMLRDYLLNRGSLVRALKKNPQVKDFEVAIQQLDEIHLGCIARWLDDLNRVYVLLRDLINKNKENMTIKVEPMSPHSRRKPTNSHSTPSKMFSHHQMASDL
eukprot:TRINITY_DN1314_c1_g1_i2.p2 TRINITY_DN1314_c1_g1~~TRINITY_DN1314_c1_g1_i2.p2  ORF type:complete len:238 (+),score=57.98 TRINITY_DN1314_c1_g1_i2:855-1568(+)